MTTLFFIALFGAIGCCARFYLTGVFQRAFGRTLPYATMIINILGCFGLGFTFFLTLQDMTLPADIRTGVLTGFFGGFTTFSTFSMETLLQIEEGDSAKALTYVVLSVGVGVSAAFAGMALAVHL